MHDNKPPATPREKMINLACRLVDYLNSHSQMRLVVVVGGRRTITCPEECNSDTEKNAPPRLSFKEFAHESDQLGMLLSVANAATLNIVFNAVFNLARKSSPTKTNRRAFLLNSFGVGGDLGEDYSVSRAKELLDDGHVVIIGGGTGQSGLTTDFAAVCRATELGASPLLTITHEQPGVIDGTELMGYDRFYTLLRPDLFDSVAARLAEQKGLSIFIFNPNMTARSSRNGFSDNLIAAIDDHRDMVGTLIS